LAADSPVPADCRTGVQSAQGSATREKEELARFENDSYSILHLARFYRAKLDAAIAKGRYEATGNLEEYDCMLTRLDESVAE
jgi:hypothetical protein